jgi:hypothetical protein
MGTNSETATAMQKQDMLKALDAHYGNVRKAADTAKIAPSTHYRWRKEDSDYDGAVAYIKDISFGNIQDALVSTAIEKIKNGDTAVLNKMLGIYLKGLPETMNQLNKIFHPKIKVGIKYIDKPPGFDKMIQEIEQKNGLR